MFKTNRSYATDIAERPTEDQLLGFKWRVKTIKASIYPKVKISIYRIENALDFLSHPSMTEEYLPFTKKVIARFIERYNRSVANQQPNISAIGSFFSLQDPLSKQIRSLPALQTALENLSGRILQYPHKYCAKPKIIITEPQYIRLPRRNGIEEQNILASLRKCLYSDSAFERKIYETINWLYDQTSVRDLAVSTRAKIVCMVNIYTAALAAYKAISDDQDNAKKKLRAAENVIRVTKLVLCLCSGIYHYPAYYENPKVKSTLAVRLHTS